MAEVDFIEAVCERVGVCEDVCARVDPPACNPSAILSSIGMQCFNYPLEWTVSEIDGEYGFIIIILI